jgi:hypothetical protein
MLTQYPESLMQASGPAIYRYGPAIPLCCGAVWTRPERYRCIKASFSYGGKGSTYHGIALRALASELPRRTITKHHRLTWTSTQLQCLSRFMFRLLTIDEPRFLSNVIRKRILNPTLLPAVLRTLRATLFPNNALGPPRQPPSDDEVREIKYRCAVSILGLVPSKLASTFFAAEDRNAQLAEIEEILSCLDDSYLNKHLVFQIVELLILRLVPELGEQGVRELMEERSVDLHTDLPIQSSSVHG